jgi:uncharacterized membrane protein
MKPQDILPQDIQKNKELAALSYMWLFSLVILLARRDSPFIQWHARQGTLLFFFSILVWPFTSIRYLEFLILGMMILGFIESGMGHVYSLPVIGDLAEGNITGIKSAFHKAYHAVISIFKPNHVTPEFKEKVQADEKKYQIDEKASVVQQRLLDLEEKKLSNVTHRLDEDEKRISALEEKIK